MERQFEILKISNTIYNGNVYWYKDDLSTAYISSINVKKEERNKGYGNLILKKLENILIEKEFKYVCLWVDKNSWMCKWYERHNYRYLQDHEIKNYAWMKKSLI